MEFYNSNFTQQLAPLVAVVLESSVPLQQFQTHLNHANVSGKIWDNVILRNRLLKAKYIFRYFQDEKAVLQSIACYKNKVDPNEKHSRLSPFNAESDLYPNGVLSEKWFEKYINHFPAAVVRFYKLPQSESEDEELGYKLTALRENYDAFGIKFIAIVVSDSDDDSTVARIALLRQASGLPRSSGLFHLSLHSGSSNSHVFEKDVETLATTLISNLKAICTDFYFATDYRIEQRNQKYYTVPNLTLAKTQVNLTPDLLEVRHSIKRAMISQLMHSNNIEGSLPILELAYANLLTLIKNHRSIFDSPLIKSHDQKLYYQWLTLLDVLVIHLIRGYFSIEEPVAALRKHAAHIQNGSSVIKKPLDLSIWTSIQFNWLADLMSQISPTVLRDLYTLSTTKSSDSRQIYYGGISFHDVHGSYVITSPSLIYARAANIIANVQSQKNRHFPNNDDLLKYRVDLLQTSRVLLKESVDTCDRVENYLEWQIAEILSQLGKYDEALKYYQTILSKKSEFPKYLIQQIQQQKLLLSKKKSDDAGMIKTAVELAVQQPNYNISETLENLSGSFTSYPDLPSLLTVEPFLYSNAGEDIHVLGKLINQFKITAKPWLREQKVGGLFLENFKVSSFIVTYGNNETVTFTGSGHKRGSIQNVSDVVKEFDDSEFKNEFTVLKFEQTVKSSGWHEITQVEVKMSFVLKSQNGEFLCKHSECHNFSNMGLKNSEFTYNEGTDGETVSSVQFLRGRPSNKIFIQPYKPDLELSCVPSFSNPIVGEKMVFAVHFTRTQILTSDIAFKELAIEIKSKVYENDELTTAFYVQHNWDQLKDDMPLDLLSFIYSKEMAVLKDLHVSIRQSHGIQGLLQSNLRASSEFRLVITEKSDVVSTYDLTSVELNPLKLPFDVSISNAPHVSEKRNLMPSPFVLGLNNEDFSMPQPCRLWLTKLRLIDLHKLLKKGDIQIKTVKLFSKTKSSEIKLAWEGDVEQENESYQQIFSLRAKTHVTQSNPQISIYGSLDWTRKGSNSITKFNTKEEEFTVSMQEPRVILETSRVATDIIQLRYTLENPTPRIVTFSTSLQTDRAALHGTQWSFEDARNLVPIKQPPFPVLPFSTHNIVFYGKFSYHGLQETIELPKLQVQDMNYKVELPTIAPQENIRAVERSLLYEI